MRSIDGDLDSDGTATDFLALESVDGLLLFGLVANVDKAITLAPSGVTPPLSNDAGRNDLEAGISEESSKPVVVDVEAEVGNEENRLGRLANRILAGGAMEATSSGPAVPGPVGRIFCTISCGSVSCRSGGLCFDRFGLVTALRMRR